MNKLNHKLSQQPEFRFGPDMEFEDYFNGDVPSVKIRFVRHYIENKMGYDLNQDSLIDFSAIGIKLFGSLLVDVIMEYEKYPGTKMDG